MGEGNITGRIRQSMYTAAALAAANPMLLDKEMVYESDTGKCKVGTGSTTWNNLPYFGVSGTTVSEQEKASWSNKADKNLGNVTLEKNLTGTTSGYYKAPDGLLIQWGRKGGVSTGKHTVYFPISFVGYPYVLTTPIWDNSKRDITLSAIITNVYSGSFGVNLTYSNTGGSGYAIEDFNWLAVGRWK